MKAYKPLIKIRNKLASHQTQLTVTFVLLTTLYWHLMFHHLTKIIYRQQHQLTLFVQKKLFAGFFAVHLNL